MSTPILPFAVWASGTNQNSIPANDNSLRNQILNGLVISDSTTAQPVSPADGDIYIIPAAATGAQWATFDEFDLTIYSGGTWYAFAPVEGVVVNVAGSLMAWDGSAYVDAGGGGGDVVGPASSVDGYPALMDGASGKLLKQGTSALGTAAYTAATAYATAAQGAAADAALQSVVAGTNVTVDNTDPQNPVISASGGGGGGSPGGSNTQVQFNDSSAFGGDSAFTYDKSTDTATLLNLAIAGLLNTAKGTDVARASTTDIWAVDGNYLSLTGTTTITSFGSNTAGQWRIVKFAGAGTLTHNATSMILPGGASITTAANDTAIVVGEGSTNARVVFYNRASGLPIVNPSASVTGWTPSTNTASPNNTVNAARMLVASASTNADGVIQAKGAGALLGQLPTATATGGNKRGQYAVDWQMQRDDAIQVASGNNSVIAGGYGNQNVAGYGFVGSGLYCRITAGDCGTIAGGNNNLVSSSNAAIGGGSGNTASGTGAVVAGGETGTASGNYSGVTNGNQCSASGRYSRAGGSAANDRGVWGADAFASASIAGNGDMQGTGFKLGLSTVDATPTVPTTTGPGTPSATNQITLPNNSAYRLKGHAIAREAATGNCKSWDLAVTIKRGADETTTAIVGTATVTAVDADAGAAAWSLALAADTTIGSLKVTATGASGKTIKWSIRLDSIEVVG